MTDLDLFYTLPYMNLSTNLHRAASVQVIARDQIVAPGSDPKYPEGLFCTRVVILATDEESTVTLTIYGADRATTPQVTYIGRDDSWVTDSDDVS